MDQNLYCYDKPDFDLIRRSAYELLLSQDNPHVGMKAGNIYIPGKKLIFSTLQEYSSTTKCPMNILTANGKISLGCHINVSDNIYLLLHNKYIMYEPCENWTNIHEIGHIVQGHSNNGEKEEVEAHFFAACFLMPDAVINYLKSKGCRITKRFLTRYFNVSPEAAEKKLETMSKGPFETELDDDVVHALKDDINRILYDNNIIVMPAFINFAALNL